jgi:predicted outer membrane repeat protein
MCNGLRWVGLAVMGLWASSAGATNAVVTNCTESGFNSALSTVDSSGGGTITFNCGTATITCTTSNDRSISSAVTIDGGGQITLDGNNGVSLIQVFGSGNATLKNLTLQHGGNSIGFTALENFGLLTLDHVRVQNNAGSASAVKNHGTLNVRWSTFASNNATGSTTDGGAIYHDGTDLHVSASTFNGNQVGRNGAAIFAASPLTIVNSTFTANTATSGGGAIYQSGSGFDSTVIYATIVGNNALFGAGLYNDGGGTSTLTIGKSIVSANTTGNCDGVLASSGYNLSNGTGCGGVFTNTGDLVNQTLNMGALASNGGPTQTLLPAAGNPAINHVPVAQCAPNIDQRGGGRPSGAGCDSGSVEVNAVLDVIFYDGLD